MVVDVRHVHLELHTGLYVSGTLVLTFRNEVALRHVKYRLREDRSLS